TAKVHDFKDDDIRVSTMKEETVKGGHRLDFRPDHVATIRSFNDVAVLTIVNAKLFYKDGENVKALKALYALLQSTGAMVKIQGWSKYVGRSMQQNIQFSPGIVRKRLEKKKRSSRGRVDEATTSRKRTRPRIIADVTGKDLVDLKLLRRR
ncbi:unnamed protein product, partial [Trichogramma brassicae]